eukprot:gene5886-11888_t
MWNSYPRLAVILVEPLIHVNTGAIGRTTLGFGCELHLIKPLGFSLSDKHVKRAGLDYWNNVQLSVHESWNDFSNSALKEFDYVSVISKRGKLGGTNIFDYKIPYQPDQRSIALIFGNEDKGLAKHFAAMEGYPGIYIPMDDSIRCYNLSNAVGITVNEIRRSPSSVGHFNWTVIHHPIKPLSRNFLSLMLSSSSFNLSQFLSYFFATTTVSRALNFTVVPQFHPNSSCL